MTVVVELVALLVLAGTGWLLAGPGRGEPWRVAVALPLGIAAFVVVELVLLATGLPVAFPWVAAPVALVGAAVLARRRAATAGGGERPHRDRTPLGVALVVVAVVVAVTAAVPLVNVTADSFRYLTVARLLAVDGGTARMTGFLLQTRSLAVGAVHGLAAPELGYLRALTPLLACSTLAVLSLLVREGTDGLDGRVRSWLAVGTALLVATNHQFVFHALYVNGHLLVAVLLLLLVAVAWRRLRDPDRPPVDAGADALPAVVLAVALTVVRPEGALLAGLALAPVVAEARVPLVWRRTVLAGHGVGIVLWHAAVLLPRLGGEPGPAVVGMVALGVAVVGVAVALPALDVALSGRRVRVLLGGHALLWVAVVVAGVARPGIVVGTVGMTLRNVLDEGRWGVSLLVLAGLLAVAVVLRRGRAEDALLFPLLSFVPVALLLNVARGGPGRLGPGDSLNRMLLHLVPLAALALALTADGEPRDWSRLRGRSVRAR